MEYSFVGKFDVLANDQLRGISCQMKEHTVNEWKCSNFKTGYL